MKNLLKKRNIVLAVIGLAIVVAGAVAMSGSGGVTVELESVDEGTVRDIIEEEAQVMSRQTKNVAVLVNGTVEKWHADIGDAVQTGDLLAEIDSTDVDKEIDIASEQLSALKYAFEDALEPEDKALIQQAEAAYNSAVIQRDSAQKNHDKNEKLFEQGAISSQTLDDSQKALDLAQQDVNGKYQALIQIRKGLSEALKNKFASEIRAQESAIEMLKIKKGRHEIRANEDGVVLSRYIESGDYVTMGMVTYEIANVLHVYFKSDILDSDVAEVKLGTPVVIHLDDENRITGSVTKVFPKAETQISDLGIEQKRVTIEIESQEEDLPVLIGQELDADFITESKDKVLRIREELTYQKSGAYHVFVEANGKVEERPIDVGLVGDTYLEVVSGLSLGEKIIVPQDDISPGVKVNFEE